MYQTGKMNAVKMEQMKRQIHVPDREDEYSKNGADEETHTRNRPGRLMQ
jgi:hypothetical protein